MSPTTRSGRRGLTAAAGALALAGVTFVGVHLAGPDGPPQPAAAVAPAASVAPAPEVRAPAPAATPTPSPTPVPVAAAPQEPGPDFGPVLGPSKPVSVSAPAIDLETGPLVDLLIGEDGVLAAPVDYARAGFHVAGPTPGQFGPSVIAGHVDGPDGPAVFYRLGELVAGDEVHVQREDGSTATFVVDAVGRYPKTEFPTSLVYGNTTDRAELRLITCGGAFDRTTGHYVDNVVVFAHLAA